MKVFIDCILSLPSPSEDKIFNLYLDEAVKSLTITVFQRVTSGILSKHSLPFAFNLCMMLLIHKDPSLNSPTSVTHDEWMALLKNSASTRTTCDYSKPVCLKPDKIPAEAWECSVSLSEMLPSFHGLLVHIVNNIDLWVQFSQTPTPWNFYYDDKEVIEIDDPKGKPSHLPFSLDKINRFHQLLLVQAFCQERLATAIKMFVDVEMGVAYTKRTPCDLSTTYQWMTNLKPILIILTSSE